MGALRHPEAPAPRNQWTVRTDELIKHGTVQVLDAAADLDDIAETFGGDETNLSTGSGQQYIGTKRGAVHDQVKVTEKLLGVLVIGRGRFFQRVEQSTR